MFEESHIQRRADSIRLIGIKNNLATIVALFQRSQNIRRVLFPLSIVGNVASLSPGLTSRERLERVVWFTRVCSGVPLAFIRDERQEKPKGLG